MFEPRATHHLASLQVRVAEPQGVTEDSIGASDQDLYHVIVTAEGMKRLQRVVNPLAKRIDQGEPHAVRDVIQHLGDRLGGTPGIAAYRGVGIDAASDDGDEPEDVWLASGDRVRRLTLIHYTRFWIVPAREPAYLLIKCNRSVRDRLLVTLETAVAKLGRQLLVMWYADDHYIGLGRRSRGGGPLFIDRPLDAQSELAAIQEMGLTPRVEDTRWSRRLRRAFGDWVAQT